MWDALLEVWRLLLTWQQCSYTLLAWRLTGNPVALNCSGHRDSGIVKGFNPKLAHLLV